MNIYMYLFLILGRKKNSRHFMSCFGKKVMDFRG